MGRAIWLPVVIALLAVGTPAWRGSAETRTIVVSGDGARAIPTAAVDEGRPKPSEPDRAPARPPSVPEARPKPPEAKPGDAKPAEGDRAAKPASPATTASAGPAAAGEARPKPGDGANGFPATGCLPRAEAIASVVAGKAIPLGQARRTAERAGRGEMISADLCPRSGATQGALQYVVTVLGSNGKVSYASIDASSGRLIGVR